MFLMQVVSRARAGGEKSQSRVLGLLNEANKLIGSGNFSGAVKKCDGAIAAAPSYYPPYYSKAYALVSMKDYKGALGACDEALKNTSEKNLANLYLLMAQSKFQLGDYHGAYVEFEKFRGAADPKSVKKYGSLGDAIEDMVYGNPAVVAQGDSGSGPLPQPKEPGAGGEVQISGSGGKGKLGAREALPTLNAQLAEREKAEYERAYVAGVRQAGIEAKKFVRAMAAGLKSGKKFVIPFPNEDRDFIEGNAKVADAFEADAYKEAARAGIKLAKGQVSVRLEEPEEYMGQFLNGYMQATKGYSFARLREEAGLFMYKKVKGEALFGLVYNFVHCSSKDDIYSWMRENFGYLNFPYKIRKGTAVEKAFGSLRASGKGPERNAPAQREASQTGKKASAGVQKKAPEAENKEPSANYGQTLADRGPVENTAQSQDEEEQYKGIMNIVRAQQPAGGRFLFVMPAGYSEASPMRDLRGRIVSNNAQEAVGAFASGGAPLIVLLASEVPGSSESVSALENSIVGYLKQHGVEASTTAIRKPRKLISGVDIGYYSFSISKK